MTESKRQKSINNPVARKVLKELAKSADPKPLGQHGDDLAAPRASSTSAANYEDAWHAQFARAIRLCRQLLKLPPLRRLAELIATAETEYMPGAPSQSAVGPAFFQSWWMMDLGTGPQSENLCSIAIATGKRFGMLESESNALRAMAGSRLGLYEVLHSRPSHVVLTELVSNDRYAVHTVEAGAPRPGHLWLTRLVPPLPASGREWTALTTPYVLENAGAKAAWLDYLERAAWDPSAPAGDAIARHFKRPPTKTWWLEYILNGWSGTRGGFVMVEGVPDRPETLPRHPDNPQPSPDRGSGALGVDVMSPNPKVRLRAKVWRMAIENDFERKTSRAFREGRARLGLEQPCRLDADLVQKMSLVQACYGALNEASQTALEQLATTHRAALDEPETRELEAMLRGGFALMQVLRVRSDEAIEVRDVLRGTRFWLSENATPRELSFGDALAGWVANYGNERKLEGVFVVIPESLLPKISKQIRAWLNEPSAPPGAGQPRRFDSALPMTLAALEWAASEHSAPGSVNSDGHAVLGAKALFEIMNESVLRDWLKQHTDSDDRDSSEGKHSYVILSPDGIALAAIGLAKARLTLTTNSRERLEKLKGQLTSELGTALLHRIDQFEGNRGLAFHLPDA